MGRPSKGTSPFSVDLDRLGLYDWIKNSRDFRSQGDYK